MKLGNSLIQFEDDDLVNKPGIFEDELFIALRKNYSERIEEILANVENFVTPTIINSYKKGIERHLFPALVLSSDLGIPDLDTLNVSSAFIVGYSLPVLLLDQLLDTKKSLDGFEEPFLDVIQCIYNANHQLLKIGKSSVAYQFNQHYLELTDSIRRENKLKFKIPENNIIDVYKYDILIHQAFYRSECHYFSAIVEGFLHLAGVNVSKMLQTYLRTFGLLRQVTDEIADVEEDLSSGILTIPVLFAHSKSDMSELVKSYWKTEIDFRKVATIVTSLNGYVESYDLGHHIYSQSRNLLASLISEYKFLKNLSLFYDLRFAFLNRLKEDNWLDYKRG